MSGRSWIFIGVVIGAFALFLVAKSCVNVNRVHTAESWVERYVTAKAGPLLGRNDFFYKLSRFDRAEATAALVAAIGRDDEAYRKKRPGLILMLARLGEPAALDGILALHAKIEGPDRTRLIFAIGACLTKDNVKKLLAACEEDDSLLDDLPGLTREDERSLDEWKDYFKEEAEIEKIRTFWQEHAASTSGSR